MLMNAHEFTLNLLRHKRKVSAHFKTCLITIKRVFKDASKIFCELDSSIGICINKFNVCFSNYMYIVIFIKPRIFSLLGKSNEIF